MPIEGDAHDIIMTQEHNHPPQMDASVRDLFIREIKTLISKDPQKPLKDVHDIVSSL